MKMQGIDAYRKEIDYLDDQILKLLNERMEKVKEIGSSSKQQVLQFIVLREKKRY